MLKPFLYSKHIATLAICLLFFSINAQIRFNTSTKYYRQDAYHSIHNADTAYIALGSRIDSIYNKINTSIDWVNLNGEIIKSKWLNIYGTSYYRVWNNSTFVIDNNFYAFSGISDSLNIDSFNTGDMVLCKFKPNGDTVFTKRYDSGLFDTGFCLDQTSDGNIICGGYTETQPQYNCARLIKYDTLGNIIWNKTFSCGTFSSCGNILALNNGDIVFNSEYLQNNGSILKSRITKVDSLGVVKWVRDLPAICNEGMGSLALALDGNILVGGYKCKDFLVDAFIIANPRIVKLNVENGATVWDKTYDYDTEGTQDAFYF